MSATHTLFYAAASPFVRKVLVLLHETGQRERVALEEVTPTPVAPIRQLNASNPAGKIPALRLPDGQVLHDSRVICDYFDQQHVGEPLIPREGSARWRRLTIASLADAVLDAAVLSRYETFVRPRRSAGTPGSKHSGKRSGGPWRGWRATASPNCRRASTSPPSASPAPWAISTCASRSGTGAAATRDSPPGSPKSASARRCRPPASDPGARRRLLPPQALGALQPGRRGAGNSRPIRAARRSPSRRSSRRPT